MHRATFCQRLSRHQSLVQSFLQCTVVTVALLVRTVLVCIVPCSGDVDGSSAQVQQVRVLVQYLYSTCTYSVLSTVLVQYTGIDGTSTGIPYIALLITLYSYSSTGCTVHSPQSNPIRVCLIQYFLFGIQSICTVQVLSTYTGTRVPIVRVQYECTSTRTQYSTRTVGQ